MVEIDWFLVFPVNERLGKSFRARMFGMWVCVGSLHTAGLAFWKVSVLSESCPAVIPPHEEGEGGGLCVGGCLKFTCVYLSDCVCWWVFEVYMCICVFV